MKSADLKVGEIYQSGYASCVKVLETKIERVLYTGKVRKDGVKVVFLEPEGVAGQERVMESRNINRLWSEFTREQEVSKLARKVSLQDQERVLKLSGDLQKAMTEAGVDPQSASLRRAPVGDDVEWCASFTFEEAAMEAMIRIFSGAPAAAQPDDNSDLADLLS